MRLIAGNFAMRLSGKDNPPCFSGLVILSFLSAFALLVSQTTPHFAVAVCGGLIGVGVIGFVVSDMRSWLRSRRVSPANE